MIHFGCDENRSYVDDGRFFRLRSRGTFDDNNFFDRRFRFFLGGITGGQISPNCDVISSIIDWFESTRFSMKNDEWDNGGVRRLTIEIECDDSFEDGGDEDKQGEQTNVDVGGMNEQVESVWSIVSRLMIVGDDDETFCSRAGDDDDEHEQWASDVIVLNNVKRIGICVDEVVFFNERRRSISFNNRSFESKSETCGMRRWKIKERERMECVMFTCVIEECGKICCIYDRRIAIGIELWHWR